MNVKNPRKACLADAFHSPGFGNGGADFRQRLATRAPDPAAGKQAQGPGGGRTRGVRVLARHVTEVRPDVGLVGLFFPGEKRVSR